MYRLQLPPQIINIFFDQGGLGDAIAGIPAVKYILVTQPHISINLFVQDYFLPMAENYFSNLNTRISIFKMSEAKNHYNNKLLTKAFSNHPFRNLSYHMTEHAFAVLADKLPEDKYFMNYPELDLSNVVTRLFRLPQKYVVVTTAFTSPTREFSPEHVNKLVKLIKNEGYSVVFLGQKKTHAGTFAQSHIIGNISEDIDFSQGLDLIDKTSLLEAAKILADAQAVVGLDNGLINLAACSDVPIVAGFTSVNPTHRTPWRKGIFGLNFFPVIPPKLKCFGCQSNMSFLPKHDFRECFYQDYKCVKDLTAEIYWEELRKLL